MNYEIKDTVDSVKDVDLKTRTVTGYFASFGNIDSDGDIFAKNAFDKTIKENEDRIMHLLQHDVNSVLGRPKTLKATDEGLYFETDIPDTTLGTDTLKLYESGVYNEHSVGFSRLQSEDKGDYNLITEVKLWEGSTVTWGANKQTPFTGFKAKKDKKDITKHRIGILKRILRKSDVSDQTMEKIQILLAQLKLSRDDEEPPKSTPDITPNDINETADKFLINQTIYE